VSPAVLSPPRAVAEIPVVRVADTTALAVEQEKREELNTGGGWALHDADAPDR
jgi:hypothetical protein